MNLEVIEDTLYFVDDQFRLIVVDIPVLHQAIQSKQFTGKEEEVLLEDVFLVCSHKGKMTILSHTGIVYTLDESDRSVDLNEAFGQAVEWSIGRNETYTVASGYFEKGELLFVLIDMASMTVLSKVAVDKYFSRHNSTRIIKLVQLQSRLFVVGSRTYNYVDVLEVVDGKLTVDMASCAAVRVYPRDMPVEIEPDNDDDEQIMPQDPECKGLFRLLSLAEHPTRGDTLLISGCRWMSTVRLSFA